MNASLMSLEIAAAALGLALFLADLWTPAGKKRLLGYGAVAGLALILIGSFWMDASAAQFAFNNTYVLDGLALFFKRFFLIAAVIVLLLSIEFADRLAAGVTEFYSLQIMALVGMMFAASANDFTVLFVSLELITVTFYILVSFQRGRAQSLEAGVKYLILGALSSAVLVYGIALTFGASATMNFGELVVRAGELKDNPVLLLGLLLIVIGLAFKIAAFPMQIWAPDVYQGAPAPVTAFLAVGSKAAGFVLLLRLLFGALPHELVANWSKLFMVMAAVTILYGSLCAIPQRSLKRLLGYSSIANAGFLLLGVAAMSASGSTAVLYFLAGYLFTMLGAFAVICVVMRYMDSDDITALAGLNQRSPLLAATMTLTMVSLAGVPPLAGFFGKFLLIRAVLEAGPAYYWLLVVAVAGVAISIWYYFGVIKAIFWSGQAADPSPIAVPTLLKCSMAACIAGMLYLGIYPGSAVQWAGEAVKALK
jgi:NADH-quinone oxidoreductase subunit N